MKSVRVWCFSGPYFPVLTPNARNTHQKNSECGHFSRSEHFAKTYTAWKVSKYGIISGPYFLTFGVNKERASLRIHSKYGKIRTRKNSIFGHFSHSDIIAFTWKRSLWKSLSVIKLFSFQGWDYFITYWYYPPSHWKNFHTLLLYLTVTNLCMKG